MTYYIAKRVKVTVQKQSRETERNNNEDTNHKNCMSDLIVLLPVDFVVKEEME